jgi:hypothetical protein
MNIMGINWHIKTLNLSIMALLAVILSSCLPMQKETQCGANEAFNATKRMCVPVVGASTGNTVFIQAKSPVNSYTTSVTSIATTHTVAVSDVYNYGYTVYWYEHYQDPLTNVAISTLMAVNTTSYVFNPASKNPGQYVLEAVLYDQMAVNQLDNVTWNVTISAQAQPYLANLNPAANAFSYPNTLASTTLSLDVINPDNQSGYEFIWKIDGVNQGSFAPLGTSSSSTRTRIIYPSTMTQGIHTVEFRVIKTPNYSSTVLSQVWIINIVNPDLPLIQTASNLTVPNLSETITVVDGINFSSSGWLNSVNTALSGLCIAVDNADKDSIPGSDIDVEFRTAGQSIGYGVQGTGPNINQFCLSTANLNAAQTYFNLVNPDVAASRSINVVTYRTGTSTQIESMTWNVVVRPKNIRPVISIDDVNTSSSMGCIATTPINYTGCTVTQSVNVDIDSGSTFYNDNADDVDNVVQLGINLDYDPDIATATDFQVFFEIKRTTDASYQNIDGTSTHTYSNCTYSVADTNGTVPSGNKYICQLRMDAFNNAGPVAPGQYIVKAFIRDANAGMGWGISPKDSNTITWTINVQERQSTGTIQIADISGTPATPALDESGYVYYGTSSSCSGAPAVGTISESHYVLLKMAVRDIERDNFKISYEMSNGMIGGFSLLSATQTITRNNNSEWHTVNTCVKVPEWAVSGATSAVVQIKATVQDIPNSATTPICFTCDTTSRTFSVNVNNFNPRPTFNDWTAGLNSVDLTGIKVFAGCLLLSMSQAQIILITVYLMEISFLGNGRSLPMQG